MKREKYVVALCRVESCYGGPEEGGWYYEAGEPVGRSRVFFNLDKARAFRESLARSFEPRDGFAGIGVGGCGDDDGMSIGESSSSGLEARLRTVPADAPNRMEPWPSESPRFE